MTLKHLSHHGTKASITARKKSVSSVCSQELMTYFTSASAANR